MAKKVIFSFRCSDEKEYKKVQDLIDKIKEITLRPHRHNLIAALESYLDNLKAERAK